MIIIIYYNFKCGIFCNILVMICEVGVEFVVIEYFKMLLFCEILIELIGKMGILVCDVFCQKGIFYDEFGFGDDKWSDDQFIDFMMKYFIFIN